MKIERIINLLFMFLFVLLLLGSSLSVHAEEHAFEFDERASFQSDNGQAVSYVVSVEPNSTVQNVTISITDSNEVFIDYDSLEVSSSSTNLVIRDKNDTTVFVRTIRADERLTFEFLAYPKDVEDSGDVSAGYLNITSESPTSQSSWELDYNGYITPWGETPSLSASGSGSGPIVIAAPFITVAGFLFSIISIILTGIGILVTIDDSYRQKVRRNLREVRSQSVSIQSVFYNIWAFILITLADFLEIISNYLRSIGSGDVDE